MSRLVRLFIEEDWKGDILWRGVSEIHIRDGFEELLPDTFPYHARITP